MPANRQIPTVGPATGAEMAAAITTISILRDTDAIDTLWRLGEALQKALRGLIDETGFPAEVVGYPVAPFLQFMHEDDPSVQKMKTAFFAMTTRHGVLFHPNHQWFLSAAHTDEDVELTIDVCRAAIAAIMK